MSTNTNEKFHFGTWFQNNKGLGFGLIGLIAVGVLVVVFMSWKINIENQGEALQERIEEAHANSRIALSACIDQGNLGAQTAEEEFDRIGEILLEVAAARYNDGSSAEAALGQEGALFSVIFEAYPDIDPTSFQNLQAIVVGCRDAFANAQERVQANVVALDTWIVAAPFRQNWIRNNFPTETLDAVSVDPATGAEVTLTGQDALDYLERPVLVADADTAFESGELEEQDLFGDN